MSLRAEENEREKSNSGRGAGLAAAAIAVGVGVGAALYYFLNKGNDNNPEAGGSSQNWRREDTHIFKQMASEDSYITVSENSTTDTSIMSVDSEDTDNDINFTINSSYGPAISVSSYSTSDDEGTHETGYITSNQRHTSTSDMSEDWNTTTSSIDSGDNTRENIIAHLSPLDSLNSTSNIIAWNTRLKKARRREQEARRMQAFRERSWTLEECSICFDVILKDQEVLSLPCTHQFHAACVMPWLEQKQTCPNCRKSVD